MPEMDIRPSSPTLTLPSVAGKIREVSLPLFSAVSCSPPCDVLHALVNSTVEEMAISPVLTPGPPLIYHIKQSIAKKLARISVKLFSRYNRGGASHAPGTPLIYHIKQSIAKKSARFSAKLSSRYNRGGASHAPGSPFIYHIKPSIAKKSARISVKLFSRYNRGGASHAP